MFASLMRMGDVAMVRGDVPRARALYERAAAIHPASSVALIAAGKTYDPNVLSLLDMNSAGLADASKAREWYERARALGDPAAASLLAPLR
jgi:TPR repeat protein